MLQRYNYWLLVIGLVGWLPMSELNAHKQQKIHTDGEVRYLGNEAIMVTDKQTKILFDPFFHNHFNTYTLVPTTIRKMIFSDQAPYNNINAIFISHAHGDHFAADDLLRYLINHPKVKLVAPKQAVDKLLELPKSHAIKAQVFPVSLSHGDQPTEFLLGEIRVEAVRIPHAGWPQRANVENIVYRLSLNNRLSVIHMGDADADDSHFSRYKEFWLTRTTNMAFPPYWFLMSKAGNQILDNRINTEKSVGVHVPNNIPIKLKQSGKDFFSTPGETRSIQLLRTQ